MRRAPESARRTPSGRAIRGNVTGSMAVFVQADEPAVERAVVEALGRQDGVSAVGAANEASWLVFTTSDIDSGDPPSGQRIVAFVTSTEGPRFCRIVGPALAALANGEAARLEWPSLSRTSLNRLGLALLRAAGTPPELTSREEAVLRLAADGQTTTEIAAALSYSERSVKNVIQGVNDRLGLRNRCHAVAHAIRHGWI